MPVVVLNAQVQYKTLPVRVESEALEGDSLGHTADYVSKDGCNSISYPLCSFAK